MNMVQVGGRLFINVPANNMFGHGFYQFSSEFLYRVFDADNGFAMRDLVVVESPFTSAEVSRDWHCCRTIDPAEVGSRIRLVLRSPLMIFVEAERIDKLVTIAKPPMQSDYQVRWRQSDLARETTNPANDRDAKERSEKPFAYLTPWQEIKRRIKQRRKLSLQNRRFFRPTKPL